MFAIVPWPPVGLAVVRKIKEQHTAFFQSGTPVIQGPYPIWQMLQAMTAEDIIKHIIGEIIGIGIDIDVGIDHDGPGQGPFRAIASYVKPPATAQTLGEWPSELCSKTFALESRVFLTLVLYGFNSH